MRRRHGDSAPIERFVRDSLAAHSRFARRLRSRPRQPGDFIHCSEAHRQDREQPMPPPASAGRARVSVLAAWPCLPGFAVGAIPLRCGHAERAVATKGGWAAPPAECDPPFPRLCAPALCAASCVARCIAARTGVAAAALPPRASPRVRPLRRNHGRAHTPSGGPSRGGAAPRGAAGHAFPLTAGPHVPIFPLACAGAWVRVCGWECAVGRVEHGVCCRHSECSRCAL